MALIKLITAWFCIAIFLFASLPSLSGLFASFSYQRSIIKVKKIEYHSSRGKSHAIKRRIIHGQDINNIDNINYIVSISRLGLKSIELNEYLNKNNSLLLVWINPKKENAIIRLSKDETKKDVI